MLILLINLERRPDRLAFMAAQLDALGLPFERIDAVDGRAIDLGPPTKLVTGVERACGLSHRKAWRRLLESGAERCLVLEDDILLSPELPAFLAEGTHFPPGADILRLETRRARTHMGPGTRLGRSRFRAHRILSTHHGCGGYMLTRAFAARAARDLTQFAEPVDDLLFAPEGVNYYPSAAYQLRPGLCLQVDLHTPAKRAALAASDIEAERADRFLPERMGPHIPKALRKRTLGEKGRREVVRWVRRARLNAEWAWEECVVRFRWRKTAFAGPILPVIAPALSDPARVRPDPDMPVHPAAD